MEELLHFIHIAERLKNELRRGYTSEDRQESVGEHTWRLSLMVMLLSRYADKKISVERALKMAIVHDLAELFTGDQPCSIYEQQPNHEADKYAAELNAMQQIKELLPKEIGIEIFELWQEYEDGKTEEAKFVIALDKMEAQIQFNEMNFSHWNDYDKKNAGTRLDKYCEFSPFLKQFKALVQEESRQKIASNT